MREIFNRFEKKRVVDFQLKIPRQMRFTLSQIPPTTRRRACFYKRVGAVTHVANTQGDAVPTNGVAHNSAVFLKSVKADGRNTGL